MKEDYYDSSEETPAAKPEAPAEKKEAGEGKTFLINKEVCPGMEPGEEMVVKIERVLDNEYEVSYAPPSEKEEPPAEEASEAGAGPMMTPPGGGGGEGELSSMMY